MTKPELIAFVIASISLMAFGGLITIGYTAYFRHTRPQRKAKG